jgi:Na+/H+ antiporter NhaD/arsenite permease-like protein
MTASLIIFALVYVLIAFEITDKTIAALLGAAVVIGLHLVPYEVALEHVDLNVIFLLVGMMIIVHILSETGLFEWIAVVTAQKAKGSGPVLLAEMVVVTAVLSAFLDNVTTVLLIAPITILITQILEIETVPFLILEAIFSNVGGTATLIGDPPNILIGSQSGLTFNEFVIHLTPIIIVLMLVLVPLVVWLFRSKMQVAPSCRSRIMNAHPGKAITDAATLKKALPVFAVLLLALFLSRPLGAEPGLIAITGAVVMVLVCGIDLHKALGKAEWNTIFFFIGLFMLISSLQYNGVFDSAARGLLALTQGNLMLTCVLVLCGSAIISAIVDNIPLVIAMLPLIQNIIPAFAKQMGYEADPAMTMALIGQPLYWSLALGACLGGNGTLIGASANVVVVQLAKKNNYPITFMQFTRYGFPIMIVTMIISSVYVVLRYFAFR